jgi:hypothetical protein
VNSGGMSCITAVSFVPQDSVAFLHVLQLPLDKSCEALLVHARIILAG